MSDLAKLKKKAAELEQRRQFDKALAVYEEMLVAQQGSDDPDVSLLNRVGDLRIRLGRGAEALDAYERAVELYVERGFLNNAIALCNKILRQDPRRAEVHYRLGRISAGKGFRSDARRHFLEYAGLMQRAGRLDEAFRALQEFADLSSENTDVRLVLAEQLAKHGRTEDAVAQLTLVLESYEMERRYAEAEDVAARIRALDPDFAAPIHPAGHEAATGTGEGGRSRPHTPTRASGGMPELVLIEPTESGSGPAAEPVRRAPDVERTAVASEALIRDDALELASDLPVGADGLGDLAPEAAGGAPLDVVVDPVEGLTATGGSDLALPDTSTLDGFEATGFAGAEPTVSDVLARGRLDIETTSLTASGFDDGAMAVGTSDGEDATGIEGGAFEQVELGATGPSGGRDDGRIDTYTVADLSLALPDDASSGAPGDAVLDDGAADPAAVAVDVSYLVDLDGVDAGGPPAGAPESTDDGGDLGELPELYVPDGSQVESALPSSNGAPAFPALAADDLMSEIAPGRARGGAFDALREERPAVPSPVLSPFESPAAGDDSFINLGDLLRAEEVPRSTRMVAEEKAPTGDEQADFAEMLRKFKQGVAENVDDEDYDSHHDLGVAYKEMGLLDEAIAEFQRALRGTPHRARSYEALGHCFLEREQYAVATSVLQRALGEPGADDQKLVGVLYLLGRAAEAMNQRTEALSYYQRVFAVDIEFADVAKRMDMAVQVTR